MKDLKLLFKYGPEAQTSFVESDMKMEAITEETKIRLQLEDVRFRYKLAKARKQAEKDSNKRK